MSSITLCLFILFVLRISMLEKHFPPGNNDKATQPYHFHFLLLHLLRNFMFIFILQDRGAFRYSVIGKSTIFVGKSTGNWKY